MPYCVNCGVELAPSEKVCPLCLTPVLLPEGQVPKGEKPYPEKLEVINTKINRKYGGKLALLMLSIPMIAVLLCDLAISMRVSWSAYVLGAGACVSTIAILPLYLDVKKPYLYIAIDFLSVAAYLLLIAWKTGGLGWYTAIALPVSLLAGLCSCASVYAARRKRAPALVRFSNMVLAAALLLIGTEICVDLFVSGGVKLQWSLYALIPMVSFAAIFRIIERNARLKAMIQRRLFL